MANGREPLGKKGYCITPEHKPPRKLPVSFRLRLYCDECRKAIKDKKKK